MLEPFSAADASAAAASLRRTGFNAQTVVFKGTAVLYLQGELDMATSGQLHDAVDGAMAEEVTGVVLDVAELTFVDSTGIGHLVSAKRRAEDDGRTFVLRNPTRAVHKTLRLTGLDQRLNIGSAQQSAARPSPVTNRLHPRPGIR